MCLIFLASTTVRVVAGCGSSCVRSIDVVVVFANVLSEGLFVDDMDNVWKAAGTAWMRGSGCVFDWVGVCLSFGLGNGGLQDWAAPVFFSRFSRAWMLSKC